MAWLTMVLPLATVISALTTTVITLVTAPGAKASLMVQVSSCGRVASVSTHCPAPPATEAETISTMLGRRSLTTTGLSVSPPVLVACRV